MGKGGGSRTVWHFLTSIDYGICYGPLEAINDVVIKDKSAFAGNVRSRIDRAISRTSLFGGNDGEGGIHGAMEFYLGDTDQRMSEALAQRYELTPDTAPGYRGLAHIFFRGLDELGFRWTSNNPYLPAVKVSVTREPRGLSERLVWPIIGVDESGEYIIATEGSAWTDATDDSTPAPPSSHTADIIGGVLSGVFGLSSLDPVAATDQTNTVCDRRKLPDANPAAIVYEVMTNARFGKGEPVSMMDTASYEAVAVALRDENFGLSMKWIQQDEIDKFISEVLDHINAAQFIHPRTGLWTLKLIRDDYDVDDLLVLDPSNCEANNIQTALWGETVNQITVSYTDPVSEKPETVVSQNAANIAIQGVVKNQERDYYGVRNPWLAKELADREVHQASRVLTSATLYADRIAQDITPGSVIILSWPEEEIDQMVMRVGKVERGDSKKRGIKIEVVEDVFSTPTYGVRAPVQEPLGLVTEPVASDLDRVFVMTPPLPPLTAGGVSVADLDANYPQSFGLFLLADSEYTPIDVEVRADQPAGNGTVSRQRLTSVAPSPARPLGVPLAQEATSRLPVSVVARLTASSATAGELLVIGDADDNHEIVMLDAFDTATSEWVILRGLYDTEPETWAAADLIWNMPTDTGSLDPAERVADSPVAYQFLPRTRLGGLDVSAATEHVFTPDERPHRPFRPANVQIDGNGFDETAFAFEAVPADITVTWADRNRLGEDSVVTRWDDIAVAPEAGQTTTIRFRSAYSGDIEHEITGLTGGSETVQTSNLVAFQRYSVEVVAVRDGIESFRAPARILEIERRGYGSAYGTSYGP